MKNHALATFVLAQKLVDLMHARDIRVLVLCSPDGQQGQGEIFDMLRSHLETAEVGMLKLTASVRHQPEHLDRPIVIEGPSLADPKTFNTLPEYWWRAAQGTVLIAMGRRCERAEISQAKQTLAALGAPVVGCLYNPWAESRIWPPWAPLSTAFQRFRSRGNLQTSTMQANPMRPENARG